MVRVRAAGALLMALALTTGAAAAEPAHRYLYMGGGGGQPNAGKVAGFFDLAEMKRAGDIATVSILLVPDTPGTGDDRRNFGIVTQTFDCKARMEQTLTYAAYGSDGLLLGEMKVDAPARPIDTAQEDAVEAIAMACGETTPDPTARTFGSPEEAAKWSRSRLGKTS